MKNLIYTPLYNILIFFYVFTRDTGISVILLTLLVRVLLLRSSIKAERSRLALQKLQPEIEKIKKQNKDNKEKQTKETLGLYQKKGINPFSSCLPTLIQLPFLIGLFVVFREGLKNGFPLYGPIKSLIGGAAINSQAFGFLDLTKAPNQGWLLIFPILAASLQFLLSKMMMEKGSAVTSSFNAMTFAFSGVTLWFTLSFPAALSLYWISTTAFAIAQQYLIDKYDIGKSLDKKTKVLKNEQAG